MPVKIPRYIYHLTNVSNYQSIVKDKVIKKSYDELLGSGVFATELENFYKHWYKNKDWNNSSLQEELIRQVAKGESDIVILRIPTSGLDSKKLIIRSQNKLFSWALSSDDESDAAYKLLDSLLDKMPGSKNWIDKLREILNSAIANKKSSEYANHLTSGESAKMAPLYKQKGEAIEFVYLDDIPLEKAEKIGQANLEQVHKSPDYDPFHPIKSIFAKLLSGTPEEKSVPYIKY